MKIKAKIVLKSLADLPANAFAHAVAVPGRTLQFSKNLLAPPVQATRRQLRAARRRSAEMMQDIYRRAHAPLHNIQPWPHGGLNE
jgi:hypothetical protein